MRDGRPRRRSRPMAWLLSASGRFRLLVGTGMETLQRDKRHTTIPRIGARRLLPPDTNRRGAGPRWAVGRRAGLGRVFRRIAADGTPAAERSTRVGNAPRLALRTGRPGALDPRDPSAALSRIIQRGEQSPHCGWSEWLAEGAPWAVEGKIVPEGGPGNGCGQENDAPGPKSGVGPHFAGQWGAGPTQQ